ncbi:SLOG cluster 4 domain-containing protein [Micromonospora aurantiaca (nom. illeg.)]|uniref:SLOG cluster 4 domain-containing protein n=2 Tax=Micromonospora aurantiaca (nom. illeg.) TaxID=47850 RepID=UPI0033D53070
MRMQVAVCGPEAATEDETAAARRVGELLAERGVTVLCGGGGGVMAAVAAGVRARSGLVIGIRPGDGTEPGPVHAGSPEQAVAAVLRAAGPAAPRAGSG